MRLQKEEESDFGKGIIDAQKSFTEKDKLEAKERRIALIRGKKRTKKLKA